MAGNVANPRIWEKADFYVAPTGTELPDYDVPLTDNADWAALGLLSEDGSSETRSDDTADHYAWGGILVRSTKSRHKRQLTVTALEDNLTVFGLVNPGSTAETADGVNVRTYRVPQADPRSFLMEVTDGGIRKRRYIPRGEVESVGDTAFSDSALTAYELTITIYPDADGVLYLDYDNDSQSTVPDEEPEGLVGDDVEEEI